MTRTPRPVPVPPDPSFIVSEQFARLLCAFKECSPAIQQTILELSEVIAAPETDEDERAAAVATIAEALFPSGANGKYGFDLEEAENQLRACAEEEAKVLAEMDAEESAFASRVTDLMKERGLSQEDLAARVGVGQPAISMMLSRNCRPQRRTVQKVADALGVLPEQLWPGFGQR